MCLVSVDGYGDTSWPIISKRTIYKGGLMRINPRKKKRISLSKKRFDAKKKIRWRIVKGFITLCAITERCLNLFDRLIKSLKD